MTSISIFSISLEDPLSFPIGVKKRISREYRKDALAAEDLDVEATAIPDADGEKEQHVCRAPEGTVIEQKDGGKFGDYRVDYEIVSVWA